MLTTSTELSAESAEHKKTKHSLTTHDEFLAIVSHDLRNPIGVITSCMEMLLEEIDERNIGLETKSWIEIAKRNADAALRLINDILDMERIIEGKLKMSFIRCDIGNILIDVSDNFAHVAAQKNIQLNLMPGNIALDIDCDRDRIIQILSNLVGNALKFTPDQGEVTIKTSWTETSLTVSVFDTGPGIPHDKVAHIFDKFAQLKSKNRTGLGLGLHISKMLVEAHNGKIWVESTVGIGSAFHFELPIVQSISI